MNLTSVAQKLDAAVNADTAAVQAQYEALKKAVVAAESGVLGWVRKHPFVACAASAGVGVLVAVVCLVPGH
jgi:ElaB/YqjD/DUF883 family membrane-anchored ribosome-binding protein